MNATSLTSATIPLTTAIQSGVYFHSDANTFSYVAACLADGLQQLGIPIYSNIDFSHPVTSFRFTATRDQSSLEKSYCVVMGLEETCEQFPFRVQYVEPVHERTVALSMHDNLSNFLLDPGIPLFCTHENRLRKIAGIRVPIAFGVSQSMLQQTTNLPPFSERREYVLRSFRPSLRQDVRACLDLTLVPTLQQYLPAETHYTDSHSQFMDLLSKTRYCLGYGGCFSQNLCLSPTFSAMETCQEFYSHLTFSSETVVTRWDSWRFWESLVAGCVTIQLDFEKYGFTLPVMPENWKHYIGLDLANIKCDIERMMDERDRMGEIAHNGRLWAIEHYSPISVARRFLKTMHHLYPEG